MMETTKKTYSECVIAAKDMLKRIEAYQVKIAECAISACDIRHGGISGGYYTIKDFAQDIGMAYKTLQSWVQIYRNVIEKIDDKIDTDKKWQDVRKTNDIISIQTTAQNAIEKTTNRRRNIHCPAEKVQKIYTSLQDDEKPFVLELTRITQSSKYALNVIGKRDLNIADDNDLAQLMATLDKASDIINDHLTKKKKAAKGMGMVG